MSRLPSALYWYIGNRVEQDMNSKIILLTREAVGATESARLLRRLPLADSLSVGTLDSIVDSMQWHIWHALF